ncbi:MAG TPA: DUF4917 family protein [Solirubrobacterales bacterium]|nr:DUF4917 family protein [Solirubrobacterales bacterium]
MARSPNPAKIYRWDEIDDLDWQVLLLGNGMSINVSSRFDYSSLYRRATRPDFERGLGERQREIFELFETRNFEVVLGKLRDTIALAEALGEDAESYRERFLEIQAALGHTVREVHLKWPDVPAQTLAVIKEGLGDYRKVFSTSYDLLAYWSIVHNGDYYRFRDCFWANDRNEFDPEDCEVGNGVTAIYYLHGALHLQVDGTGATRKLVKEEGRLLDQFGQPISGDPEARPLLVSEGSHRDKVVAIEDNAYLAHAYDQLKAAHRPLVVFGHSLGEQDRHLCEAINANPERAVAVSVRVRDGKPPTWAERELIREKLSSEEIYLFDAATHPLGSPELRVRKRRKGRPKGRRLRRRRLAS